MGRKYWAVFGAGAAFFTLAWCLIGVADGWAQAPEDRAGVVAGVTGRGVVAAVEGGGVLRLDDGRRVRPALLEARADLRGAVAALLAGRAVTLRWPEERHDRHGRLVAHVVRDDGLWLQRALVEAGAARVVTFADERAEAAALLAAEDAARRAGRGLWADAANAPLPAADVAAVAAARGTFAVIEGHVAGAAVVRGRLYLNFGADWREDVTVSVAPAALRTFPPEARDAAHWQGRRLRARGWVRSYNGPLIEADHPEALETLSGN